MASVHPGSHHCAPRLGHSTLERRIGHSALDRRIAQMRQQIADARAHFHATCRAVTEAEQALCTIRMEREKAALRLAQLAEILESLENTIEAERPRTRKVH